MSSSVDEFLGSSVVVETPAPAPSLIGEEAGDEGYSITQEYPGVEVYYQASPRLYRVNGVEVPSVTSVLDVLGKNLTWWGQQIGVKGVLELHTRGKLDGILIPGLDPELAEPVVTQMLTAEQLTVNHVRDKAGDRGNSVHRALEDWVLKGIFPRHEIYPESERGHIHALGQFILAVGPLITDLRSEIMVGSLEHMFAGRYDLRFTISDTVVLPSRLKTQPEVVLPAGTYIADLKTSKGFYETHFLQVEAYEVASTECGFAPTDGRLVIKTSHEGELQVELSKATEEDFLAVLFCHRAIQGLRQRRSARRKKEEK